MDRLKYLMMALLILGACTKNDIPETLGPDELWVSVEDTETDTDTKTSLSPNDGKTKFVSGDRIMVYDSLGCHAVYRFQTITGNKTKFLQVTEESDTEFKIAKFATAFYPAGTVTAYDKTTGTFTAKMPQVQTYATDSFSNGAAPMASNQYDRSNKEVKFKNCFGVVRLGFIYEDTSTPLTIQSISLTSASTNLSGDFKVSVTGKNSITVTQQSGDNRQATLDGCLTAGGLGSSVRYFYIAVPGIKATSTGEKISVEITPTTGVPFSGYFMASKGTSSISNKIEKNHILQLEPFSITPIDAFDTYTVEGWQRDTLKVGQITVPESSYTIPKTDGAFIDVQINGATVLSALTATVKNGAHFNAGIYESAEHKFYARITKSTGWYAGESGMILINDTQSNSGVYINITIGK